MSISLSDIRDLISLDDAVDELGFGPNGGLLYCMEYSDILPVLLLSVPNRDFLQGILPTTSIG